MERRSLLKFLPAVGAAPSASMSPRVPIAAASSYRVGIGKSTDPYTATHRAIAASGEWPSARVAGRTVVIKPNLLKAASASSGVITDPRVVQAIVDHALRDGAAAVLIVEGGDPAPPFSACGYDFFRNYEPDGRVALVNLNERPLALVPVPDGLAYRQLYLPQLLLDPNVVFVSAAKLKCHGQAGATLATKNLFGLPPWPKYYSPDAHLPLPRNTMHVRGMAQTVVDLNLARSVDFAVVDGVWGMEGEGPGQGTPVEVDVVLAGRNSVAVDRACLGVMGVAQDRVQHLTYAAQRGLGPADFGSVLLAGDTITPRTFLQPLLPPTVWFPVATPGAFAPVAGQRTLIRYRLDDACLARVTVARTSDTQPLFTPVRTLRDWTARPVAIDSLVWDGRDDAGALVPSGGYTVQIEVRFDGSTRRAFATGRVYVASSSAGTMSVIP